MALDVADELDEGRLKSAARIEFGLTLLAAGDRHGDRDAPAGR